MWADRYFAITFWAPRYFAGGDQSVVDSVMRNRLLLGVG